MTQMAPALTRSASASTGSEEAAWSETSPSASRGTKRSRSARMPSIASTVIAQPGMSTVSPTVGIRPSSAITKPPVVS